MAQERPQKTTTELDNFIDRAEHLPPAPQLLPELLQLLGQPNIDADRVVRLITFDPTLSARVLKVCNSAAEGAATPVASIHEAVVRLGFDQVYRVVAAVSGSKVLGFRQKQSANVGRDLWKHSLATAIAAQIIAQDLGEDRHLAFTAALLHDLGKIVLFETLGQAYLNLLDEVEKNQYSLADSERAVFGVQHSEIGGRLMSRWNFPIRLVAGVWFHHHPAAAQAHHRVAAMVHLGNVIAYLTGFGYGHQAIALNRRTDALGILGLDGECLPRYMLATYAEINAVQSFFNLGHG